MGLIFQEGEGATNDLQPHMGGWRGVQMEREVKLGVEVDISCLLQLGNDLDLDKEVVTRHVWQGGAY